MPLKLRPTGLGSGVDKDRPDYGVYCGEWCIGRIYEVRGGPAAYKWFWTLALAPPMARSDRAASLEEANAQFQKSWGRMEDVGEAGGGVLSPNPPVQPSADVRAPTQGCPGDD